MSRSSHYAKIKRLMFHSSEGRHGCSKAEALPHPSGNAIWQFKSFTNILQGFLLEAFHVMYLRG